MNNNIKVYLVGGAVRDKLLGRPVQDADYLVVGATPELMLAKGFIQVGVDFPVFLHPQSKQEYALARTERKSGSGYQGFTVHASPDVTLEEDLIRRDLTINAMAIEVKGLFDEAEVTGQVIDSFNGLSDMSSGILRHVSPAFSEDPLRVLRVARFYSRYYSTSLDTSITTGFRIADETRQLMIQMVANNELDQLSRERIWTESERATMMSEHPQVYWDTLFSIGAFSLFQPLQLSWENSVTRKLINTALSLAEKFDLSIEQRWALLTASFDVNFSHSLSSNIDSSDTQYLDQWLNNLETIYQHNTIPKKISNFSKLYARNANVINQIEYLSASQLMSLLQGINGHKQPENIEKLLMVNKVLKLAKEKVLLQITLDSYQAVGMQDIDAGLKGKAIGEALFSKRIEYLTQRISRDGSLNLGLLSNEC